MELVLLKHAGFLHGNYDDHLKDLIYQIQKSYG